MKGGFSTLADIARADIVSNEATDGWENEVAGQSSKSAPNAEMARKG